MTPSEAPAKEAAPGPVPRALRVFVSSTFRDMQAERDELVKHTFPQLRRLCTEKGSAQKQARSNPSPRKEVPDPGR